MAGQSPNPNRTFFSSLNFEKTQMSIHEPKQAQDRPNLIHE